MGNVSSGRRCCVIAGLAEMKQELRGWVRRCLTRRRASGKGHAVGCAARGKRQILHAGWTRVWARRFLMTDANAHSQQVRGGRRNVTRGEYRLCKPVFASGFGSARGEGWDGMRCSVGGMWIAIGARSTRTIIRVGPVLGRSVVDCPAVGCARVRILESVSGSVDEDDATNGSCPGSWVGQR